MPASSQITEKLLNTVESLQNDDPDSACQILLVCAVYQNYAYHRKIALEIVQRALTLAEHKGIVKARIWSAWGAAAIYFQDKAYGQTATYLKYLKTLLGQQNEWILANFVDIVQQSLPSSSNDTATGSTFSSQQEFLGDTLNIAFDWLQHWGFLPQPSGSTYESTASRPLGTKIPSTAISQSMFSVQQWKQQWHDFTLAIRARLNLTRTKTKAQVAENRRTIAASTAPPESSSNFTAAMEPTMAARKNKIKLVVQMLGSFSITIEDQPIKLPASRGLSLLKYLLLHHKQDTLREVLMEIFWPDSDPEASRNNLNVAMHSLRQALRSFTDLAVIRFENGAYGLDTNLELWLDVEEFERCVKEGQRLESQNQLDSALTEFEIAVNLYRGDFLADTPYESWTVLDRERLRIAYLDILEHLSEIFFSQERYAASATLCQLILSRDLCREDAHCRLMQCYSRLGQVPLALRQYQICVEALRTELEVDPAPETRQLYERIRHHEHV